MTISLLKPYILSTLEFRHGSRAGSRQQNLPYHEMAASERQIITMPESKQIILSFLGGADSIGASCTLVEIDDTCILIDCGIRMKTPDRPLPDLSALNGKNIDAILLTHAHTDHTGALPVLCEAFPSVPVIATAPTLDLITILFKDALKISASERDGEIPLYNKAQVERALSNTVPTGFRQPKEIKQVTVTFLPASHIIGAAMIHLATPGGYILFTGDYSVTAAGTVPALDKPAFPVDLLISESTYGTRLHEDRTIAENRLVQQINELLERKGKVLIPCFAIGRAQEVILILQNALRSKKIPSVPVYVDGMVRDVCTIYSKHEAYVTTKLAKQIRNFPNPFFTNSITPVTSPQMRNTIPSEGPCVIIASSGMLTGGASAFYAQKMLGNENDGILLTGYQDEESPGRVLLSLVSNSTNRTLKIFGEPMEVKSTVATFNLSAHADRLQMASLIESLHPRTVALVHGDNEARIALKNCLQIKDCLLVENGTTISRTYPVRHNSQLPMIPALPEIDDITRLRAIVGTQNNSLVKGADIAYLWFGCKADAVSTDLFLHRLEELGVAKRDDIRRGFLHVITTPDSDLNPEEFLLELRLKNQNPKGRLLEYCMKKRVELPPFEIESQDGYYYASVKITIEGKLLSSIKCKALSKKTAQQLAAENLLSLLPEEQAVDIESDLVEEFINISDLEVVQLRINNHKGKLYEFCAAGKVENPVFFHKSQSGKHLVKLADKKAAFETKWYSSTSKIAAEHAASYALLTYLQSLVYETETAEETVNEKNEEKNGDNSTGNKTGNDPRGIINNFLQTKQLLGFGYDLVGTENITNQTLFTVTAWVTLPDTTRIQSSPFSAHSKKEAQCRAAADVLKIFCSVD